MGHVFENTPLGDMFRRARTINADQLFIEIMSQEDTQEFVVKLNTDQLRFQFINRDGVLLSQIGGEYADSTVKNGRKLGKFKVDLYDSGEYHESFRVENVSAGGFEIKSDPNKGEGTILLDEWGEEIEGLTFESMDKLAEFLVVMCQNKIRKILLG